MRAELPDEGIREAVRARTKEALQALACAAEVQIALFPNFVCVGDELALDFEHWREVYVNHFGPDLTAEQRSALDDINQKLLDLSHEEDPFRDWFWSDEGLKQSTDWVDIRNIARRALELFGWPTENPPPLPRVFIPAGE